MLERASIADHATGRNRTVPQGPEETLEPLLAQLRPLDVGERARDALERIVHGSVNGRTVLGGEAVFLVPDVERSLLEGNGVDTPAFDFHD